MAKTSHREKVVMLQTRLLQEQLYALRVAKEFPLKGLWWVSVKEYSQSTRKYIPCEMIVEPIALNSGSVRFQVLAISSECSLSYHIKQGKQDIKQAYTFKKIYSWRPLIYEDLPLIINWYWVSKDIQKMLAQGHL